MNPYDGAHIMYRAWRDRARGENCVLLPNRSRCLQQAVVRRNWEILEDTADLLGDLLGLKPLEREPVRIFGRPSPWSSCIAIRGPMPRHPWAQRLRTRRWSRPAVSDDDDNDNELDTYDCNGRQCGMCVSCARPEKPS